MTEPNRQLLTEYLELPYTLVGSTSLLSEFHITLTVEGLRKILERAHDEDLISITIHEKKWTEFEIVHMKRSKECNANLERAK